MGTTCFTIHNIEEAYWPGQAIIGNLQYNIDGPTEFKSIVLSLIGEAKCSFKKYKYTEKLLFSGYEEFLNDQRIVRKKGRNETILLPKGSYEFPFQFELPKNLPTSYKNSKSFQSDDYYSCNITYTLIVRAETPEFEKEIQTYTKEVTVYGDVDSGGDDKTDYILERVISSPKSKKIHTVRLQAELRNKTIRPGESIHLNYTFYNDTTKEVRIKIRLIRNITLKSDFEQEKKIEEDIKKCAVETKNIKPQEYDRVAAVIPTLPELYSIQHSNVISVEYFVKITVCTSVPHVRPSWFIPVVIGETEFDNVDLTELSDDEDHVSICWEATEELTCF